ncbi:hypothetical protein Tco_0917060 [Tanacetum coccineum]
MSTLALPRNNSTKGAPITGMVTLHNFCYEFGAQGSSRSSILGEATINLANLADYADASQPAAISLPLVGSDHGTILHVSVQLLATKTRFREFEQQRDKGLQSGNNVDKETEPNTARSSSSQLEMLDDREVNKEQISQKSQENCQKWASTDTRIRRVQKEAKGSKLKPKMSSLSQR